MNVRYARKARRGRAAVALAAGLALVVTGCGGEEEPTKGQAVASTTASKSDDGKEGAQSEAPPEVLAVLKGQDGLELTIHEAKRDVGGFLTVTGNLKNTSDSAATITSQVSGDETEILKHGSSFGGATLVDSVAKKRYYVLRDTDGRPLTTTGLSSLGKGRSTNIFMQFPAPPANTTEVTFQLPTFRPGTIKLS
ncbi:hypothetical protein [Streptomyces sp. NPDC006551]|uniref:hypothetical protein n=1 Tax=Streptomyces sp. NPDC006551 TaxID=3157178 RepID=UPI0033A696CA